MEMLVIGVSIIESVLRTLYCVLLSSHPSGTRVFAEQHCGLRSMCIVAGLSIGSLLECAITLRPLCVKVPNLLLLLAA